MKKVQIRKEEWLRLRGSSYGHLRKEVITDLLRIMGYKEENPMLWGAWVVIERNEGFFWPRLGCRFVDQPAVRLYDVRACDQQPKLVGHIGQQMVEVWPKGAHASDEVMFYDPIL